MSSDVASSKVYVYLKLPLRLRYAPLSANSLFTSELICILARQTVSVYTSSIGEFMSEIDLAPLNSAIESYIPLGRSGLLPALHVAQKIYGWLPEEVAAEIARSLHVPLVDVHGVIEFYSLFYNEQVGKKFI